jgi:hypothetical protein
MRSPLPKPCATKSQSVSQPPRAATMPGLRSGAAWRRFSRTLGRTRTPINTTPLADNGRHDVASRVPMGSSAR